MERDLTKKLFTQGKLAILTADFVFTTQRLNAVSLAVVQNFRKHTIALMVVSFMQCSDMVIGKEPNLLF